MSSRRCLLRSGVLLAAVFGCEHPKQTPPPESATSRPARRIEEIPAPRPQDWDRSAGPVLLVSGESPSQALVIVPDSATAQSAVAAIPRPAAVTLLGRGGTLQVADLRSPGDTDGCHPWPVNASPPLRPWSVGFIGGVVTPVAMDSSESFARPDSSALAVALIRLASTLPNDSAGRFTGLAFAVRGLWRFAIPSGQQVVVATFVRQINQEATPLQERTLLIAERSRAGQDTTFSTAYSERSYGDEENIETREVLAAVELGGAHRPTLVVARDFGDATSFGFIERGDDGRWRTRWTSARRHC